MKPGVPRVRRGVFLAVAVAILAAAGGCANRRENAWLRETEKANETASAQEDRRKRMNELTPWERERQEQEERW